MTAAAPRIERERGLRHPAVPDRQKLLHPGRALRLEHADRIRTVGRGIPLGVGRSGNGLASARGPRRAVGPRCLSRRPAHARLVSHV